MVCGRLDGHVAFKGQAAHFGSIAVQNSLPSDSMFTCREKRKCRGIRDSSWSALASLMREEMCLGTRRSLRATRQQCESTGNTARPSAYSITHLAIFLPTPGKLVRKVSHRVFSQPRRGARVGLPNSSTLRRMTSLTVRAFLFDKPPREIARAICATDAAASSRLDGNVLLSAV